MAQDFNCQPGQILDLGTPKQRFENNKQVIQPAKELASTGAKPRRKNLTFSRNTLAGETRASPRVYTS